MATKDIRSDLLSKLAFIPQAISTDTTTTGTIIDTADFDAGVMFTFFCSAYTDGTYTPLIYEGDASDLSDKTAVADANLQGTEAGVALTAVDVEGANINTIGVSGTKRYIRFDVVSTSTSSGATVGATFTGAPEVVPDANLAS